MNTIKPGKQRKQYYNAPKHIKRKNISAHLEENLLLKYDKRSITVIKGDTVKVMRGSYRGHEDKVAKVNVKKATLEIEGLTMSKADGNKIAKPINHSNVIITKLNLTDKWRRSKLEKDLSEDAKKEIEKEAEQQIKEAEEQKRLEEEARKEEERKKAEEEKQEQSIEKEDEEQEKAKPDDVKKQEKPKKTEDKKAEPKKPTKTKKQSSSKTTKKSSPAKKKTPAKKPAKKEGK